MPTAQELSTYYSNLAGLESPSEPFNNFNNIVNTDISLTKPYVSEWQQKKANKQSRLDNKLATLKSKGMLLQGQDDGDSSEYLRMSGIDTPETFHELDLHNEKTKMYKQYRFLHPEIPPQQAYQDVENQYAAFKVAKEQGQDLPGMIAGYRAQGLVEDTFAPTAFDIHQAGVNSTEYSKQYDQGNLADPTTGFSASGNLVDGSTGYFDRFLVKDDKYRDASIAAGMAAPGASDSNTYAQQLKETAKAKNKKLGNYSTKTGAKVMDAIMATSSAKSYNEGGMKSTGDMLHYESPEEFQFQVGSKISDGQLTRDQKTGKYYEIINNKRVEVHPQDVSSMYVAANKQGTSTKLGVARADLTQEMWDKYGDMAPMVARYMDKTKNNSPYTGKGGTYDGTPGPEGINVKDPNAAVIYMRTNDVEALEKYIHTHGGQVEARTAGSDNLLPGNVSATLNKRFGAGTSEYTKNQGTDAAPLWNDQYDMNRVANITDDLKAEPMPSKSKAWDKIKDIQKEDPDAKIVAKDIETKSYSKVPYKKRSEMTEDDYMQILNELDPADTDGRLEDGRSITDQATNFFKGIGQGAVKTGVLDTIDFIGEATGIGDLGTAEEKEAMAKKVTGYDSSYADAYMKANEKILGKNAHEINEDDKGWFDRTVEEFSGKDGMLTSMNNIISNMGGEDFSEFMSNAFANTDTTAYSLGMLLGMTAGSKGTGLAKVGVTGGKTAKESVAAINASTAMTAAEKTIATAGVMKEARKNANILQKTVNSIGKNSGLMTINAGQVNDQLDEFEANMDRPATAQEKVTKYFTNLGGLYIDRVVDVGALKGVLGKDTIKAMSDLIRYSPKGSGMQIAQKLTKSLGQIALAGVVEFPTEGIQTAIEELNKVDITTEKGQELYKEKAIEILNAAGAGMGGGMHMATGGQVGSTVAKGLEALANKKAGKDKSEATSDATEPVSEVDDTPLDTVPTEDEVTSSRELLGGIKSKLIAGTIIGDEDIEAISTISDTVARYEPGEAKDKATATVKAVKAMMAEALDAADLDANPLIFGATKDSGEGINPEVQAQAVTNYITDVLEGVDFEPSESLEAQLIKVAEANGVTKKQYHEAKSAIQVEQEATVGKGGYKTYGVTLAKILSMPTPDKVNGKKLVNRIHSYKTSQQNYADTVEKELAEVTKIVNTYNKNNLTETPKKQYAVTINQPSGTHTWTINVTKGKDGKYTVDGATQNIIDTKRDNVKELGGILSRNAKGIADKLDIGAAEIGTGGVVRINTTEGVKSPKGTKARQEDNKYSAKYDINKVITTAKSKWTQPAYSEGNEDAINTDTYSKDDNVLLSVPNAMKTVDLKSELADKYSVISKALNAAVKAGATIVLDRSTSSEHYGAIASQLITYKKYASVKQIKTVKGEKVATASNVFKPVDDVTTVNTTTTETVEEENKSSAAVKALLVDASINKFKGKTYVTKDVQAVINDKFGGDKSKFDTFLTKAFNQSVQNAVKAITLYNNLEEASGAVKNENLIKAEQAVKALPKVVREEAESIVEQENITTGEYSKMLEEYNKALEEGDKVKMEEILESLEDNDVVNYVLDNSQSKGLEAVHFFTYTNTKGETYTRSALSEAKLNDNKQEDSVVTTQEIDINKIVNKGKPTFLNSVAANVMGKTVSQYTNSFINTLKKALASATPAKIKNNYNLALSTDPARALMYSVDPVTGKEVINENVALALQLAIDEFIAYNSKMLDTRYKSDADLASMLGIDETAVDNKLREAIGDKGMFKKTLSNSLGKATIAKMGLTRAKDIDVETFDKLAADLGNMGVMALVSTDNFTADTSITSKKLSSLLGTKSQGDGHVTFVRFSSNDDAVKDTYIAKRRELFEDVHENVQEELAFRKEPSTTPIKNSQRANKVAKTKIGATTSSEAESVMEGLRDIEWHVDFDVLDRVMEDEESLKEWLGYTEDTGSMSFYDTDGQVSKNRDILKSIEELRLIKESGNQQLFFDWFYSSNGRYMMDANTLNPQTDKLHRFIIQPLSHKVTLVTGKGNTVTKDGKDITHELDYALVQAMGFDVDKKDSKTITKIGKALRTNKTAISTVKKALTSNSVIKIAGIEMHPEHIAHAYQALITLEKLHKGGTFETSLTAETDAVTSGFALKLMQLPILGDMFKWLNKVGVFRAEDLKKGSVISMNDILSDGTFTDSYQTLAKNVKVESGTVADNIPAKSYVKYDEATWTKMSGLLPQFDEAVGIVDKELRSLFKDPFMTFNYSAGMKSIRNSLTNVLTNKVVTKMINADKGSEAYILLESIASDLGIAPSVLQAELVSEPLYAIKGTGKVSVESILNTYINAGYGATVEAIMTEEFSEFVEAQKSINEAFKAMFAVFNKEYKDKIAKVVTAKGFVTNADKLEVIDTLRDKFPAIKGPMSDKDDKSDYVAIYRTKNAVPGSEGTRHKSAQTYLGEKAKEDSNVVAHEIKVFEEAISAGSVVPIHYIDGALMGKLLNNKGNVFTAIHDAIMMPLGRINEGAKEYNKLYREVSTEYSFIDEIVKQLANIDEKSLSDKYYNTIKDKKPLRDYILTAKKDMEALNEKVKVGRESVANQLNEGSVFAHMAAQKEGVYYHNMEEGALGASDQGLPDVVITNKQLEEVTIANEKYIKANPKVVTEGKNFEYLPSSGVITVVSPAADNDVTNEEYQVYLAHEIRHAKTYEWLSDPKNKGAVVYLRNSLRKATAEFKPETIYEDSLLFERIKYANKQRSDLDSAAEIVAILSSEPHIREQFIKHFPQKQASKLIAILDAIKNFLGIHGEVDLSTLVPTIDAIVDGTVDIAKNEVATQLGDRFKDAEATYWKTKGKVQEDPDNALEAIEKDAVELSKGLLSEVNTKTNAPRHIRKGVKGKKNINSPITVVGVKDGEVLIKYPNGAKVYSQPAKEISINQDNMQELINKYEALGAKSATPGISTQELAALKTLYQATSGPVKAEKSGIIPLLISGKAKTEALQLIKEASAKCKG